MVVEVVISVCVCVCVCGGGGGGAGGGVVGGYVHGVCQACSSQNCNLPIWI